MSNGVIYYSDESDRPSLTIWHRINRFLSLLLAAGVIALVVFAFLPELEKQRTARAQEEHLKVLIDQRKALLARQEREVTWLKNDPAYVEIIARDRLDLMKEGETIYRLDPPKANPGQAPTVEAAPAHPLN